jgi:hypothetical protein
MTDNLPEKSTTSSQILLYKTDDGHSRIEVRLENETVWLSQKLMAELFQTTKQNISLHTRNIFKEGELEEASVVKEYLTTASDGKTYLTNFYNLDVIIAVGYRIRSHRGTQFRQWATERLREYIVKGFTLDDERLQEPGGLDYFDELLERIRAIRASEKRFYQKIRDIYATSAEASSLCKASGRMPLPLSALAPSPSFYLRTGFFLLPTGSSAKSCCEMTLGI